MTDGQRMTALSAAVLVLFLTLSVGMGQAKRVAPLTAGVPLVGRPPESFAGGPPARFRHIRRTTDAERESARWASVAEGFQAALVDQPWPDDFQLVVVHPLSSSPPAGDSEEGAPWHLLLGEDGVVTATSRLLRGRLGAPSWLPVSVAAKAIHVAVPAAAKMPAARGQALRDLLRWVRRRLGRKTSVLLAPDVPGATCVLPQGADRSSLLPENKR